MTSGGASTAALAWMDGSPTWYGPDFLRHSHLTPVYLTWYSPKTSLPFLVRQGQVIYNSDARKFKVLYKGRRIDLN